MEIVVSGKQSGKTYNLIKACAEKGGYIVCLDHKQAYSIAERAREMGLDIPFPLTADEFLAGAYHPPGVQRLFIDNADMLLQSMASVPIEIITMTDSLA